MYLYGPISPRLRREPKLTPNCIMLRGYDTIAYNRFLCPNDGRKEAGEMKNGRLKLAALACVLAALLSGCFFRDVDQLYAVPEPPADYPALPARLSEVIALGGE